MGWQPEQWTTAQLEARRLAAARLLRAGQLSQAAIARQVGVSRASVTRWKQCLERQGLCGLHRHGRSGRPSHLTATQWRHLFRVLRRGAQAAGFENERWTRRRIAQVIAREFQVRYQFRALGPALHARGWSPQQPIPRARERDDALVAAWLKRDWPRIKRGLAVAGVRLPSWTRRVTRFGPGWAPPGPHGDIPRSCVA